MAIKTTLLTWMLVVGTSLAGCTSTRALEGPANLRKVKVSEPATIYERDGRVSRITVSGVTDSEIRGYYAGSHQFVTISLENIETIEVERVDIIKSALAGTGAVIGAAAAALLGLMALLVAAGA